MDITIEYSNVDKYIAHIPTECIRDAFASILNDLRTIRYKEFKENDNDADC